MGIIPSPIKDSDKSIDTWEPKLKVEIMLDLISSDQGLKDIRERFDKALKEAVERIQLKDNITRLTYFSLGEERIVYEKQGDIQFRDKISESLPRNKDSLPARS
jgi:hypothetical protein